jgi:hypothetical protein
VDEVLRRTGRWEQRRRKLPARVVVWLVLMLAWRSDLDGASLWRQVCGTLSCALLLLEGVTPPVKSALAQARRRLGCRPLRQLLKWSGGGVAGATTRGAYYRGLRLVAMDGDDYRIPDTPANSRAFGRPSTRRREGKLPAGYPAAHTMRLIEVGTRVCLEALIKPYGTSDHTGAGPLLKAARRGDLVLWDCGFYSFAALHQAQDLGLWFLGPAPSHVVLTPLTALADGSYLAKVYPSPNHRRDDRGGQVVRVLDYRLEDATTEAGAEASGAGRRHRLVSNLLDAQRYPALELIGLYHQRWEIETANDEMTTHLLARPVELRSRTPAGVVQEYYGLVLAHNAVRTLMHEAAQRVDLDPRRLSFMHAVRVLRDPLPLMRNAPTGLLPDLYRAMLMQIACGRLPPPDGRSNPRVVKVLRPSRFPAKRLAHHRPPQPQRPFLQSIVMLN